MTSGERLPLTVPGASFNPRHQIQLWSFASTWCCRLNMECSPQVHGLELFVIHWGCWEGYGLLRRWNLVGGSLQPCWRLRLCSLASLSGYTLLMVCCRHVTGACHSPISMPFPPWWEPSICENISPWLSRTVSPNNLFFSFHHSNREATKTLEFWWSQPLQRS